MVVPRLIQAAEFENSVLQAEGPVLALFVMMSLGSRSQLLSSLNDLDTEYAKKCQFMLVDIEQSPDMERAYNVRGVPTLIVFKNGKPLARKLGTLPTSLLSQWLDTVLA